jgi:hypothetical protein
VGDLCVTGHRAAGRFRIAGDVPHHHGRRRSCCRPSPVQLASLGDACDRREAVGTTRAARDLVAGEKSPVKAVVRRGQRGSRGWPLGPACLWHSKEKKTFLFSEMFK